METKCLFLGVLLMSDLLALHANMHIQEAAYKRRRMTYFQNKLKSIHTDVSTSTVEAAVKSNAVCGCLSHQRG